MPGSEVAESVDSYVISSSAGISLSESLPCLGILTCVVRAVPPVIVTEVDNDLSIAFLKADFPGI